MKCEICNDSIPKGLEKYVGGKVVCDYCFGKQRKNVKVPTKWVYIKWIMDRREKMKRNTSKDKKKNNKGFPYKKTRKKENK